MCQDFKKKRRELGKGWGKLGDFEKGGATPTKLRDK